MSSLGTSEEPPLRRWGKALSSAFARIRPTRSRAVVCAPLPALDDRPLVVHDARAVAPAGWPTDFVPETDTIPRPSTYVVWVDEAGCLHSALRVGQPDPRTSLGGLRYVLENPVEEALGAPLDEVRVTALRWDLRAGVLPRSRVELPAEDGLGVDARMLEGVARHDVALRQRIDPASTRAGWKQLVPGLTGSALIAAQQVLDPLIVDIGAWELAAVAVVLMSAFLLHDRWCRSRAVRDANAFRVQADGEVELTATPFGISARAGSAGPPPDER
jgi:hypothetical protein